MIVIEIRLNGELKATCGSDSVRQLAALVRVTNPSVSDNTAAEECVVECSGIRSHDADNDEVLKWVSARIRLGDEVSLRVVQSTKAHEPIDRQLIPARPERSPP